MKIKFLLQSTMSFKIVFAGTPEFAVPSLQALLQSSHSVIAVYTQPDRPSGRGQHLTFNPIKTLATTYSLPIYQPIQLHDPKLQQHLQGLGADIMVVIAYGLILPRSILTSFPMGAVNVHASLLPRWRGASPIQSAILAGDSLTGITIIQMTTGLDSGPILYQTHCSIQPQDTSGDLHDRLAKEGAQALMTALQQLETHSLPATSQDEKQVTYASENQQSGCTNRLASTSHTY